MSNHTHPDTVDTLPLFNPPEVPRRLVRVTPLASAPTPPQLPPAAPSSTPPALFPQPLVREIHKNAWLKRLPSTERRVARRPEKWWVVFCVHDDVEAWLEFYSEPKGGVAHRPLHALCLNPCLHVSPSLVGQEEFAVTLPSGVVRLLASNWDQMIEWVESLQGKLREMNIFAPKDNFYSKPPERCLGSISTRDPNSPLPPTPFYPPQRAAPASTINASLRNGGSEPPEDPRASVSASANGCELDVLIPQLPPPPSTSTGSAVPQNSKSKSAPAPKQLHPPDESKADGSGNNCAGESGSNSNSSSGVSSGSGGSFEGGSPPSALPPPPAPVRVKPTVPPKVTGQPASDNVYEHLFLPDLSQPSSTGIHLPPPPPVAGPSRKARPPRIPSKEPPPPKSPPPLIPRRNPVSKRLQRLASGGQRSSSLNRLSDSSSGSGGSGTRSDVEVSATTSATFSTSDPSPLPSSHSHSHTEPLEGMIGLKSGEYRIRREEESAPGNLSVPLKEAQVQRLESEMTHQPGVRLTLRKRDLLNSIALVDYQGAVWIAGWKQREHPVLYYAFHVGDQVVKVAGVTVHCALEAQRAIRIVSLLQIEVIVRRLPYGKVFVLKRSREGEPLGLVAEGSSGEISEVLPSGLAHGAGVPPKGPGGANWYLTEINSRPLSLFSKGTEVKDRLNAVGKEISILVQPADLVKHLRKGLKGMKGFKEYVVG